MCHFSSLFRGDLTTIHLTENGLGLQCDLFWKVSLFKLIASWSQVFTQPMWVYIYILNQSQIVLLKVSVIVCLHPCCPEGKEEVIPSAVLARCFHTMVQYEGQLSVGPGASLSLDPSAALATGTRGWDSAYLTHLQGFPLSVKMMMISAVIGMAVEEQYLLSIPVGYNYYPISSTSMWVKSEHGVFNPRGLCETDFRRDWQWLKKKCGHLVDTFCDTVRILGAFVGLAVKWSFYKAAGRTIWI